MSNIELLKAALEYSQQGFYVFPLRPNSKVPLTPNGFKDASIEPEIIKGWWNRTPNANVAIATGKISNLLVVDIDGKYPSHWPEMPETTKVKTSKGYHFYFRYPDNETIKSRAKIGGHDIDVRANGGYIVAPPSIHPDGGRYEFTNN